MWNLTGGTFPTDDPIRLMVPKGATIYLLSVLAPVAEVSITVGGNGAITVPAGTPFTMERQHFPRCLGPAELLLDPDAADTAGFWALAWGSE